MDDIEREYEYKPRWTLIVFCALFFGLGAVVLAMKAASNDRGLIINGMIELGPDGATMFYWILCICSVGFVAISAFLVYHRLTFHQRLAFGPAAVIFPASRWSAEEQVIAYREISALSTAKIHGQRFLYVTHLSGTSTIMASMLPSKAAFDEVRELLEDKVRVAQIMQPNHADLDNTAERSRS